jgi:hypothetical protein
MILFEDDAWHPRDIRLVAALAVYRLRLARRDRQVMTCVDFLGTAIE